MALRPLYRPFRPDLDRFLYAAVGEERGGAPLSLVSAFVRLDLDPWHEASRLASLEKPEAGAQLAEMILRLPEMSSPLPEARRIADDLIELLPGRAELREAAHGSRAKGVTIAPGKAFLLAGLLLVALALAGMAAMGDLPFGDRAPSETLQSAPPANFNPPLR
jgi:hypothetical protein